MIAGGEGGGVILYLSEPKVFKSSMRNSNSEGGGGLFWIGMGRGIICLSDPKFPSPPWEVPILKVGRGLFYVGQIQSFLVLNEKFQSCRDGVF